MPSSFAPEYAYTPLSFDRVHEEANKIQESVRQFCSIAQIPFERIEINAQTLKDIIERVNMRKYYFKIFHSGMIPNEYKTIIGLECFWILKLRPFFMKTSSNDPDNLIRIASWINEKIALHMVCSVLKEFNPDFFSHGKDVCDDYCRELEYSFRYRDLSKESMYLLFDPFYYMKIWQDSATVDGKAIV